MKATLKIFVSSVPGECIEERRVLEKLIESDDAMRSSFISLDPSRNNFTRGQEHKPSLKEVTECDIFIAFIGSRFGEAIKDGMSAVELEFREARARTKTCLVFVSSQDGREREPRLQAFLRYVGSQLLYQRYKTINELRRNLAEALSPHIPESVSLNEPLERRRRVTILFGHRFKLREVEEPTIILTPASDGWNDFTFRTRFDYEVRGFKRVPSFNGHLHLAFVSNDDEWRSPADEISRRLREAPNTRIQATDLPQFFTMQEDMPAYRNLVREMSSADANEFLSAINDVVATKTLGRSPSWLDRALASPQFNLAFVRRAETFFAFHNAGSILEGLDAEILGGISSHFHLTFRLPTFENSHEIKFQFNHLSELPRRIAVVIGKNGVGKSQTLSHLASFLLQNNPGLTDGGGDRPIVNRLVAVSSPGETYNTFPKSPKKPSIQYRRIYLSKRQQGAQELGLGEALVQLARSDESIKGRTRWQLFCDIVSEVMPLDEIFIESRNLQLLRDLPPEKKGTPVPLTSMLKGGEQNCLERWASIEPLSDGCRFIESKVIPLSSGQITFLRFAAQTCLHIENGTMLLFDEPETHLHPNLIVDFVRLLDRLLIETGSFAILATHSAYFVREVPRSQVVILRTEGRTVDIPPARLKTLGADIGAISAFIFEQQGHGELINQLAGRLRAEGGVNKLRELEDELPAEAIMHLRHKLLQ